MTLCLAPTKQGKIRLQAAAGWVRIFQLLPRQFMPRHAVPRHPIIVLVQRSVWMLQGGFVVLCLDTSDVVLGTPLVQRRV